MKVNNLISSKQMPSFKAAQVNILATSDNHGNVHSLPKFVKTVESYNSDIFEKADNPSTLNIFAIAGDWFINPSKKGFITKPNLSNGDIQLKFLKRVIDSVHKAAGKGDNFDTIFAMGNHDLDGGDKFMVKAMNSAPMKTLITNLDLSKSSAVTESEKFKSGDISKSIVYEIPDDKNPDLKHKVLFLGVTIPTMDFYNPKLLKEMEFLDNGNVKDADLNMGDINDTINSVAYEVHKFKKENPKGAVVLLSHMGDRLAKVLRDKVPQINLILNGHDHKFKTTIKGATNISSLGKDNEMIKSFNLHFDDNGKLETTDMNTYFSDLTLTDSISQHPLQTYLKESFARDMQPRVSLKDITGEVTELDYGNEIRYSNSYLANYLTSAVKRSVRTIAPDVFAVGLQSSIIRGGIKDKSTNMDLMKVFDGVSENLSNLQIGDVTGKELVGLITENVIGNLKAPTRNTIIQWSDIQVNRTLIDKILKGQSGKKFKDAIKVKNQITKQYEPIDVNKQYKIVLCDKYLIKDDIVWPKKIRDNFTSLDKTYDELFKEYLYNVDNEIKITPKTKEQRII